MEIKFHAELCLSFHALLTILRGMEEQVHVSSKTRWKKVTCMLLLIEALLNILEKLFKNS